MLIAPSTMAQRHYGMMWHPESDAAADSRHVKGLGLCVSTRFMLVQLLRMKALRSGFLLSWAHKVLHILLSHAAWGRTCLESVLVALLCVRVEQLLIHSGASSTRWKSNWKLYMDFEGMAKGTPDTAGRKRCVKSFCLGWCGEPRWWGKRQLKLGDSSPPAFEHCPVAPWK